MQFLFHEKGVISLAANSVHLCSRRVLTQWHISYVCVGCLDCGGSNDSVHREDSMTNLCCMSFLGKESCEILAAGCQSVMYRIDVERGKVIREVKRKGKTSVFLADWMLDPQQLRVHYDEILQICLCRNKHRICKFPRSRLSHGDQDMASTYSEHKRHGRSEQLPRHLRMVNSPLRTSYAGYSGQSF